ncbi:transcription elongation factor Spt5 [Candidatus Pacearchaeota archaeon]|nr:transcription elongation factor Spt5 [Candidatus Pacearchaeota archaeon]|tara:strand:- start:900 stop:1376 length:477 start_codon:yes stop_codon:yes gene_type:complete
MIFVLKVTTNKEEKVVDLIAEHVMKKTIPVYAIAHPEGLRGYIILEAQDRDSAEDACFNLPYVKGIIGKTISYEEIKNMLEVNVETVNIEEGDIVEILSDTLKKEKAKVTRIDRQKGEVVVNLLGAVVQIPVTIKMEDVKVIRRSSEAGDDDDEEMEE